LISGAPFLGYHLPNCTDEQNSFAVRIPGWVTAIAILTQMSN
jgi:hypothetical protein